MTARLIIAPVGLQPAAVLAPLLSPPVKPEPGDSLLLIATDESYESAKKLASGVRDATAVEPDEVVRSKVGSLSPELIESISASILTALRNGGEVGFVVNGGDGMRLHQLLDAGIYLSAGFEDRVWLASSNAVSTEGSLFFLSGRTAAFNVAEIPCETLLRLLNLRLNDGKLEIESGRDQSAAYIEGIPPNDLRALRGSLYACIDSRGWPTKGRLYRYRKLLRYGFLQDLGLEKRRLLLRLPGATNFTERAKRDGIATTAQWKTFDAFLSAKNQIARPKGADVPQPSLLPQSQTRPSMSSMGEDRPLLTTLGPNPGPTLQAITAHGNARIILLCDETNPQVCSQAHRIAEMCRDRHIEFVPMGGFDRRLESISLLLSGEQFDRPLDINITPGEKLRRLFLQYWARKQPWDHRIWILDQSSVRTIDGREEKRGRVSLEAWVSLHTEQDRDWGGPRWTRGSPVPARIRDMAFGVLDHVLETRDLGFLHALWATKDRRALRLVDLSLRSVLRENGLKLAGKGELRVSRLDGKSITKGGPIQWPTPYAGTFVIPQGSGVSVEFKLADLARPPRCSSIPQSFLPVEYDAEGYMVNGKWFEWIVAALLSAAGVEEVRLATRLGLNSRGHFDDDLDILTAHNGAYALWSCKTGSTSKTINPAADDAAGSAQRFLGHSGWAVVVSPRISKPHPQWRPIAQGRWRIAERTDVIDLSLWRDPSQVLALASEGAGASRR